MLYKQFYKNNLNRHDTSPKIQNCECDSCTNFSNLFVWKAKFYFSNSMRYCLLFPELVFRGWKIEHRTSLIDNFNYCWSLRWRGSIGGDIMTVCPWWILEPLLVVALFQNEHTLSFIRNPVRVSKFKYLNHVRLTITWSLPSKYKYFNSSLFFFINIHFKWCIIFKATWHFLICG